jgi:prephenate dehydratase
VFFVDIDGHEREEAVAAALTDLRASCETLKVLGSYPRAEAPAPAAESQTAGGAGKRP